MAIQFTFRPLSKWPRAKTPDDERKAHPFKAGYAETLRYLWHEVCQLDSFLPVVIEADFTEWDIRNDGAIRADARQPKFPGVILSFTAKVGGQKTPLKFVCDDCRNWQDNIRAIALTLERLRLADRYGVTKSGEQYTGWRALPGPLVTPAAMTVEEAAKFVAGAIGVPYGPVMHNPEVFRDHYRQCVKKYHPDSGNGAAAEWATLQSAADALKRHHGIA